MHASSVVNWARERYDFPAAADSPAAQSYASDDEKAAAELRNGLIFSAAMAKFRRI
jgi:hypothetical protein